MSAAQCTQPQLSGLITHPHKSTRCRGWVPSRGPGTHPGQRTQSSQSAVGGGRNWYGCTQFEHARLLEHAHESSTQRLVQAKRHKDDSLQSSEWAVGAATLCSCCYHMHTCLQHGCKGPGGGVAPPDRSDGRCMVHDGLTAWQDSKF